MNGLGPSSQPPWTQGPALNGHWSSVPPLATTESASANLAGGSSVNAKQGAGASENAATPQFTGPHAPSGTICGNAPVAAEQASNAPSPFRLGEKHPLKALAAKYPTHKGPMTGKGIKNVGRYVELGEPGPLEQLVNMPRITYKNGLLSESTYADIAKAGFDMLPKAQQAALREFTDLGYSGVNDALRDGKLNKRTQNVTAAIRNASHEIDPGTVLSRRLNFENSEDLAAILGSKGKVLQEPAIMSTSINPSLFKGNVHMKLTIGPSVKGLYVGPGSQPEGDAISETPHEQEILLPENTRLHIQEVERAPKGGDDDGFGAGFGDGIGDETRYIVHANVLATVTMPATQSTNAKTPKFLSFLRKL